jgi:vacuolar-type H+-ATPase subunit H
MEEDVLSKVMEAEEEIEKRLEKEKEGTSRWLDGIRKETEERVGAEELRLRASLDEAVKEALLSARDEADRRKARAARLAEGLRNLSDGQLREIVARHMSGILPG